MVSEGCARPGFAAHSVWPGVGRGLRPCARHPCAGFATHLIDFHASDFAPRCIITIIVQRQSFDADYVQRLSQSDPATERDFVAYFSELLAIKLRSRLR